VNPHVAAIAGRLSLRPPQRESLEILARVAELLPLRKGQRAAEALDALRSVYPQVEDFERDFPSLCFALATGVGKTRLMGAFIAYLHRAKGIRHFFVLAPNLTIHQKLIADFTPNTEKYVFQGVAELATDPPAIITGENYESGLGVRVAAEPALIGERRVHVNIFNVSKINSEVRGGRSPRIKRLSEYVGQSYFDYLAGLDDLVLLMDESHRYRASAGVRAINELRPTLGLELTATPQVEGVGGTVPFRNVIYSYPLARAIEDGFVKEPAVATRENFRPDAYGPEAPERLKLEDGVRIHESVKVELDVYARQTGRPRVKPFVLVVARDVDHAQRLVAAIESAEFSGGRYRGRVAQVHSKLKGEEQDDVVQRLLAVEKPDEPTEIVVHVNMLKEGWDVRNLYTIVPLRAADSRTLVEQSIGRGLRLPYGVRTGVPAVDRRTIVAHDRFQEIIDEANRPGSVLRMGTVIMGRDVPETPMRVVSVEPVWSAAVGAGAAAGSPFASEQERAIAAATLGAIWHYGHLPSSSELEKPEIQERVVADVRQAVTVRQLALPGVEAEVDVSEVVRRTVGVYLSHAIDIPRVVVQPRGAVTIGYRDFDLDLAAVRYQPVPQQILIEQLRTHEREKLAGRSAFAPEARLEDHLVRAPIDFDDVDYDDHASLLYKLAGQLVAHLRSYLADDDSIANVLQYYQRPLCKLLHAQMDAHRTEEHAGLDVRITRGCVPLRESAYEVYAENGVRHFRAGLGAGQSMRTLCFEGFEKCVYTGQKFDSRPELRFATLLEDEPTVLRWVKPPPNALRIYFAGEEPYQPDCVVELPDVKLLCEVKRADLIDGDAVQSKARAARAWCAAATQHAHRNGGKAWEYLLIPDHRIDASTTLAALRAAFSLRAVHAVV